jgi:hypothetical protein
LNESLRQAERALTDLNLGVTASVCLDPDTDDRDWNQRLRFGKDGNTWRLLVESGPWGGDSEEWSESPLLNTSKETRLQAAIRLPALYNELIKTAEAQATAVKEHAAQVNAFVSTISRRK